jgi:beta-lactamase regulating signal transducer with metallopeptidase domain
MTEWDIFFHPWFYDLGWTLIHAFWQGALIAGLLGLALKVCHYYPARLRYSLTVAAMLLWFGAAAVTFASLAGESGPQQMVVTLAEAARARSFSLSGLLESRFDPAVVMPLFMLFWLAGVVLMSMRTMAGLYGVFSLKHRDIFPLPREWQQQISAWFREWGVRRLIPVSLSARVQVPVVAGFFKQSLLLPLSFLTAFPPEQVQAILAHEVAHFLRRDALINLLQTLMEILFFYHPAVWWISARMRDEREYCCDDYAITKCGRPMLLARALMDLQNLQTARIAPVPVLSAAGRLQTRIKRLFNLKENPMEMREKLLALLFLIGLGLALVPLQGIGKSAGMPDDQKKKTEKIEVRVEKEGDDEKVFTVITSDTSARGKNFNWQMDDDKNKVITIETSSDDSTGKCMVVKVVDVGGDSTLWHLKEGSGKTITINSCGDDSVKKHILLQISEGDEDLTLVDTDSVKKKVMIVRDRDYAKHSKKEHGAVGEKIRTELAKDGIIAGENTPVEFKLTEKELIVNGVKQSDAAHKKYKKILSKRMGLDDDEKLEIKLQFKQAKE